MHPLDPFVSKTQKGLKDNVYDAIRGVYAAEDRLNVLTEMLSIELSPLTVSAARNRDGCRAERPLRQAQRMV